jgi:hypothetical protein
LQADQKARLFYVSSPAALADFSGKTTGGTATLVNSKSQKNQPAESGFIQKTTAKHAAPGADTETQRLSGEITDKKKTTTQANESARLLGLRVTPRIAGELSLNPHNQRGKDEQED